MVQTLCRARPGQRWQLLWHHLRRRSRRSRDRFPADHCTGTDHHSFGSQCHSDVADQCHRLYPAIHHKPCVPCLDHQYSRPHSRQRPEHRDQSHLRRAAVFPVEPVIGRQPSRTTSSRRMPLPWRWSEPLAAIHWLGSVCWRTWFNGLLRRHRHRGRLLSCPPTAHGAGRESTWQDAKLTSAFLGSAAGAKKR